MDSGKPQKSMRVAGIQDGIWTHR